MTSGQFMGSLYRSGDIRVNRQSGIDVYHNGDMGTFSSRVREKLTCINLLLG